MSNPNMYVPIDFSNLTSIIPEDEQVIYSGYGRCEIRTPTLTFGKVKVKYWFTHFLVTPNGIAFNVPQKDKTIKIVYISMKDVSVPGMTGIIRAGGCMLEVTSHREFKDPIKKLSRKRAFVSFMAQLVTNALKKEIDSISDREDKENQKKTKKLTKAMNKAENTYRKWVKWAI